MTNGVTKGGNPPAYHSMLLSSGGKKSESSMPLRYTFASKSQTMNNRDLGKLILRITIGGLMLFH